MLQPGRQYSAGNGYRYGFNGKEMDNEVSGQGNQYDYGFRIYNPRLGRFLSVDPLTTQYPMLTPYQYASNTPISAVDIDGLESDKEYNKNEQLKQGIGWIIKMKANEIGLAFKVAIAGNPYTSLAIKAAKGITKDILNKEANILHKNANDLNKTYSDLREFYHMKGFYSMETRTHEKQQDLSLQYNAAVEGSTAEELTYPSDTKYLDHQNQEHTELNPRKSHSDPSYDPNLLTKDEAVILEQYSASVAAKFKIYSNQNQKVVHYQFLNNFAKEFTPESIMNDISAYINDIMKGPQKEHAELIDELQKWINPQSSDSEKIKAANNVVRYYVLHASSEIAYHIRILNFSTLTEKNLIK